MGHEIPCGGVAAEITSSRSSSSCREIREVIFYMTNEIESLNMVMRKLTDLPPLS